MVFQPTFPEIETAIVSLFDKILTAAASMPRLETKLFAEWEGRAGNMEVSKKIIILNVNKTKFIF